MKTSKIVRVLFVLLMIMMVTCGAAAEYTVDFAYSGMTFSMPGESNVTLEDLFEKLGIPADAKDIISM